MASTRVVPRYFLDTSAGVGCNRLVPNRLQLPEFIVQRVTIQAR
jgi:hypothetical protein